MKKYILIALIISLLILALFGVFTLGEGVILNKSFSYFYNEDSKQEPRVEGAVQDSESVEKPSVFKAKIAPDYGEPIRIYAYKFSESNDLSNSSETEGSLNENPKIIDAEIVKIGLDIDGKIEAPSDWDKAGWYKSSAKVGEEGNVLIFGHYDNNFGQPAAFYNLKTLKVNDKVYLVDSFGRPFTYIVKEVFHVHVEDTDRIERVLESNGTALTLTTCGGVWIPSRGTYNNRLVVRAQRMHE